MENYSSFSFLTLRVGHAGQGMEQNTGVLRCAFKSFEFHKTSSITRSDMSA